MKKIKFIAALMGVLLFCPVFFAQSANVGDAQNNFASDNGIWLGGYLTEEAIFEAIAFTYGDLVLGEEMETSNVQAPNGNL